MIEVPNTFKSEYSIFTPSTNDTCSLLHDEERLALCGLMKTLYGVKNRRMLEIGTYRGVLLVQLRRMDPDMELHSLAIAPEDALPGTIEVLPVSEIGGVARSMGVAYTQHIGDSVLFDFSSLPMFDALMVDGAHDYYHALSDTIRALPRMNPGALILWHDVDNGHCEGVRRAIVALEDAGVIPEATKIAGTVLAFTRLPKKG